VIDTLRPVSLPEGVEITLRLAGPVARSRAWLIDFALRLFVAMSLPAFVGWMGPAGFGIISVAMFVLWVLYPVLFEGAWNGATPGKRICQLAVVNADGTPIGWPAAFLRNVLRFADALPIGYVVGLACMASDRQFRRLGDLAAGTVVIHRDSIAHAKARPGPAPRAPPVALTPLEQRAVLDFSERRPTWSAERAAELAETAAPLVEGLAGEDAVTRIDAIAAGLMERR
jgi:uncharacterized RDD family membrane protein YckC